MVIENQIRKKLEKEFKPIYMEIVNESRRHHAPPGAESHFKLLLVSSEFNGVSRIERQKRVHQLLSEELKGPIHALTMKLMDVPQWESLDPQERKFKAIGHHPAGVRKPE